MTTTAIPTTAVELEDLLNDTERLKTISEEGGLGEVVRKYVDASTKKDPGIQAQIDEGIQRGFANLLREHGATGDAPPVPLNLRPGADTPPTAKARNKQYNRYAPGAKVDGQYTDMAEFLQATWNKREDYLTKERNEELAAKAKAARAIQNSFGSIVPGDGGFLIPEEFRSEILAVALEQAIVRPRATVIPMSTLRTLIPTIDDTSHASSVFGGVVAYWTEEGAALTESQATFGRVALEANKLTAYAVVPNELLADAPAFSAFIGTRFPQAVVYFEDVAFMQGSGAGEPLGFINCPAAVIASAVAAQGANTIVVENLAAMYARMLPTSLMNAVWIADIGTLPQLMTMALAVGNGGGPVWMAGGYGLGAAAAPPMTIFGRPVVFTEKCPALGTTGDINFVDLSYYLIGDRQIMQSSSSEHVKFANDQTAYRLIERVTGRPWLQSAITPRNSGNTLSAFVQLSSTRT